MGITGVEVAVGVSVNVAVTVGVLVLGGVTIVAEGVFSAGVCVMVATCNMVAVEFGGDINFSKLSRSKKITAAMNTNTSMDAQTLIRIPGCTDGVF